MVEYVVSNSSNVISWLVQQGVPFTTLNEASAAPKQEGLEGEGQPRTEMELASLHLTKEAGHSHRRIIHATDATGKAVFEALHARALEHPNIDLLEGRTAIDLVLNSDSEGNKHCTGLYVLNQHDDSVELLQARHTVLATGGASKAYLYTSNPDGASGDGIAMAWRAGCRVANMEFNQFHPTCLYHPQAKSFLITEALRGEGALLELPDGTRFMPRHDERAELAPRDVVARAIDYEMKRLGCDCVYLNISHKPAAFIESHFPTIYARCLDFGIDISKERIPVVPAAHYTCGGVIVDKNSATDIANLYAVGETSFTGLHGANRMASNSLLECFVLAFAAAKHIQEQGFVDADDPVRRPWDDSRVSLSENQVLVSHNWDELRRCMWDFVGIVRNNRRLERADRRLELIEQEVDEYYRSHRITSDLLELRNLILVSRLIVSSARSRKESRGLHYNLDYPELLAEAKDTVLEPSR